MLQTLSVIASVFLTTVTAQANITGNCVTGRIDFNPARMMNLTDSRYPGSVANPGIDLSRTDLTVDYGYANVIQRPGGGVDLKLTRQQQGAAQGVRISTTRYMHYGRVTARMRAIGEPGVITTFITMSDVKDEIDWEVVGANRTQIESNVFYKGIQEFVIHGRRHPVPSVSEFAEYTLDWRHDAIHWYIGEEHVRTHSRDGPEGTSPMTPPGERWFPQTPSLIQIAVWDAGEGPAGTSAWAGGKIPWGDRQELSASFEWIDIQCYNDKDEPVDRWPQTNENPLPAPTEPRNGNGNAPPANNNAPAAARPPTSSGFGGGSNSRSLDVPANQANGTDAAPNNNGTTVSQAADGTAQTTNNSPESSAVNNTGPTNTAPTDAVPTALPPADSTLPVASPAPAVSPEPVPNTNSNTNTPPTGNGTATQQEQAPIANTNTGSSNSSAPITLPPANNSTAPPTQNTNSTAPPSDSNTNSTLPTSNGNSTNTRPSNSTSNSTGTGGVPLRRGRTASVPFGTGSNVNSTAPPVSTRRPNANGGGNNNNNRNNNSGNSNGNRNDGSNSNGGSNSNNGNGNGNGNGNNNNNNSGGNGNRTNGNNSSNNSSAVSQDLVLQLRSSAPSIQGFSLTQGLGAALTTIVLVVFI